MNILPPSEENISKAVHYLDQGELVVLPTETVYGLAADATNGAAVPIYLQQRGGRNLIRLLPMSVMQRWQSVLYK